MKNKLTWLFSFLALSVLAQEKLTLEEAILMALEKNFDVLIQKNAQKAAAINNNWGYAGAYPTLSLSGSEGFSSASLNQKLSNGTETSHPNVAQSNSNAGLNLSWKVFDGMKMFAAKKRLEELETMGELNFRSQMNTAAYNVIAGYYQLVQLLQQKKALEETIGYFSEREEIAKSRFTIGTAPKTDYLQAQVDLNQQKGNLLTVANNIRVAKSNFNHLLARAPETAFDVQDTIEPDTTVDFATLQQKAQTDNYDLLLAKSSLSALVQQKNEIRSLRLPSVTLNGGFNLSQNISAAGFTLLNRTLGPGGSVGVNIPLFQGNIVRTQQRAAETGIKGQELSIERLKNQVQTNLINAYYNFQNALDLVTLQKNTLKLIEENNVIATERFRKLAITSLELRQIQVDYITGQTAYINALYAAKLAEAEMKLLAGVLTNL